MSARAGSGEEQVPVGPRPLAMGGAFTAVAEGPDALYWNPAGLGRLRVSTIRVTNAELYGLGIQDNVVALVSPLGARFGVGLEWYHSGFDDGSVEDKLNRLTFALGWQPIPHFSAGASLKYNVYNQLAEGVDQGRGSGVGMDLGLLFQPYRQLTLGAIWRDVGGSTLHFDDGMTSRPYDSELVLGVACRPHPQVLLTTDLGRDFHAGAEVLVARMLSLRGGWSKDLQGLDGGRVAGGIAVRWGPALVEYTYQDHAMLDGTHTLGAALDFTLAPQLVEIGDVQMQPLFASFYKSYAREAPGSAVVTNLNDEPVQVEVRIVQNELLDEPTQRTVYLRPGVAQEIPLALVFPPRIVDQDEMRPVDFEVEVAYQSAGRRRTEKRSLQTYLYGRGTLDWSEGTAKAAAFVTPTHEMVHSFTRDIVRATAQKHGGFLNRTTAIAMRLFDGMSACGLTYAPDPLNPYAQVRGRTFAVDDIQYPAELLVSRTGDCDDSTVLYASLLANVGVASAFVEVPGHIFLMFDTGIHARERDVLGVDPVMLVEHEGSLWIPVETTSLGQPFHVAWQRGVELVQTWEKSNQFDIVDLLAARQRYEAAVSAARLPKNAQAPAVDAAAVVGYVDSDLRQLQEMRKGYMEKTYMARLNESDSTAERLQLARVYYINQDYTRARQELDGVPEAQRGAAHWNNLGDVHVALGASQMALESYTRAHELDSADPGIALNLGLALHMVGQAQRGQTQLAEAVAGTGGVEPAMALLGIRPSDVELPETREGETIALEQLSLRTIERLLREAMAMVPPAARTAGPPSASSASDSLAPAGSILPKPGASGAAGADSAAAGKKGVTPNSPSPKVNTLAAGSLGEQVVAANIAELLYWKKP